MPIPDEILGESAIQGFRKAKQEAEEEYVHKLLVPGGLESLENVTGPWSDGKTIADMEQWRKNASEADSDRRYSLSLFIRWVDSIIRWTEQGEYAKALNYTSFLIDFRGGKGHRPAAISDQLLQAFADEEWAMEPSLKVREVARRIAERHGGTEENLRKRIRFPR